VIDVTAAILALRLAFGGAPDTQVAAAARADGRAVVTQNVADYAAERDIVLVFVLKKTLPAGGGHAAALDS
jgi:predicted nucleic acid-binding protein